MENLEAGNKRLKIKGSKTKIYNQTTKTKNWRQIKQSEKIK
jgi:hypothetical protein